jgi:hypothetical protein
MRRRLLAFLWACALACAPDVPGAELPVETLVVGNVRITAEVAATREDRSRGLMHRESLPEDHGMLFIYPEEAPLAFWMRNTSLPLSIAFADGGGRRVRGRRDPQDPGRPGRVTRDSAYDSSLSRISPSSSGWRPRMSA